MLRLSVFVAICSLLCGCYARAAGDDSAGQKLQAKFTPVVVAVRAYQQKHGVLPDNLALLVPEFLAQLPANDPSSGVVYHLNVTQGTFTFLYTPSWPRPGRGSCSTSIKQVNWQCAGFM